MIPSGILLIKLNGDNMNGRKARKIRKQAKILNQYAIAHGLKNAPAYVTEEYQTSKGFLAKRFANPRKLQPGSMRQLYKQLKKHGVDKTYSDLTDLIHEQAA